MIRAECWGHDSESCLRTQMQEFHSKDTKTYIHRFPDNSIQTDMTLKFLIRQGLPRMCVDRSPTKRRGKSDALICLIFWTSIHMLPWESLTKNEVSGNIYFWMEGSANPIR